MSDPNSQPESEIATVSVEKLAVYFLNEYRRITGLAPVDSLDHLSDFAKEDWRNRAHVAITASANRDIGVGDLVFTPSGQEWTVTAIGPTKSSIHLKRETHTVKHRDDLRLSKKKTTTKEN
jgi:hypothetical protein